jgi:thioredoxin-like negative regulator of GroEL
LLGVVLILSVIAGCSTFDRLFPTSGRYHEEDAEVLILQKGNEAVRSQKYSEAEEIFNDLRRLDDRESVRRKALYGLSCARMITAEGSEDAEAALELWDAWAGELPEELEHEDPRLLHAILLQKIEMLQQVEKTQRPAASKRKIAAGSKSGGKLKMEIQRLQDLVKELEDENRTLKHQLQSLEAIDQKIQKKKEKIDSPQSDYIEIPKP